MSRTRYRFSPDNCPHFLTCTVEGWLPIFNRLACVEIVFDSWRYLQREGLVLHGYVILDNHLHWIAAEPELSKAVARFKSFTAQRLIELLKQSGAQTILEQLEYYKLRHKSDQTFQLWQEGSHPQAIDHEEMMVQKLEYMHNNPVKRGYVDEPVHWRYSSARNYAGKPGLIEVVTKWW